MFLYILISLMKYDSEITPESRDPDLPFVFKVLLKTFQVILKSDFLYKVAVIPIIICIYIRIIGFAVLTARKMSVH